MSSNKERWIELLSLTRLFLLREYSLKEKRFTDPMTYAFFQSKTPSVQTPKVSQKNFTSPILLPIQPSPPLPSPTFIPSTPIQQDLPPSQSTTITPSKQSISPSLELSTSIQELPKHGQVSQENKIAPPKQINQEKNLRLEPYIASPSHDHGEFWKLFEQHFPEIKLSQSIPDDAIAKKIKNAHLKTEISSVILLCFRQDEKERQFLNHIAKAISLRLAPASVLAVSPKEQEIDWEKAFNSPSLRLIIASDYDLYLQPTLMRYYRESPQQGKHFLNDIPLLLLSDLSLYLKETQLKALLWRAICNEFNTQTA